VGAATVFALGINPAGDIVGRYDLPDGSVHGFHFSKGKALEVAYEGAVHGTVPHAISPNGEIVGYYLDQQRNFHGFVLPKDGRPEPTPEPAGAIGSGSFAVNAAGQIGGFYYFADRAWHGFLLTRDDVRTIDMPGATSTTFWGMNGPRPRRWYVVLPWRTRLSHRGGDCAADCVPIDVPGAISTRANSIDPQGNIIGYYTDAARKTRGFLMVPLTP
jgi:hypothetical protein